MIQGLAAGYYDIRQGLGFNKSPEVYGAFPMDPYSHTPKDRGAKQPGMTRQVKEEILTRQVEMGLVVKDGQIQLSSESLAFTFCQTPIMYQFGEIPGIQVHFTDRKVKEIPGACVDMETSQPIFKREPVVDKIIVTLDKT